MHHPAFCSPPRAPALIPPVRHSNPKSRVKKCELIVNFGEDKKARLHQF
jgi:hypothetical protein